MLFFEILVFSILFINSFGLDVVKEIECQNEEECKIQFENYLQEQKRISFHVFLTKYSLLLSISLVFSYLLTF